MGEKKFTEKVVEFCKIVIQDYLKNAIRRKGESFPRVDVTSEKIYTGSIPWSKNNRKWEWKHFSRQIDVTIGIRVRLEGEETLIPLIAIELKSGWAMNSDELDKKSAIYGPLRELYPWVHTVFIHEDISKRNLGNDYLLRNGRHFNTIYTEWDKTTQGLFKKVILQQLEYQLEYWNLKT